MTNNTTNAAPEGDNINRIKLSTVIQVRIIEVIMQGGNITVACATAGISRQTFYRWFGENPTFREAIERARSMFVYRATQTVYNDLDNVKTAMWVLKRNEKKEEKWDEIPERLPYNEMSEEALDSDLSYYEGKSQEIRSEFARRHPIRRFAIEKVIVTDPVSIQKVLCINVGDETGVTDQPVLQDEPIDPTRQKLMALFGV